MSQIFKKVGISTAKAIFSNAKGLGFSVRVKMATGGRIDAQVRGLQGDKLVCVLSEEMVVPIGRERVTVCLIGAEDKYFCQTDCWFFSKEVYIELKCDLYHLQRRKYHRTIIPNEVLLEFEFGSGKYKGIRGKVRDISVGGASLLFISDEPVAENEQISGRLFMDKKIDLRIQAVVMRADPPVSDGRQSVGIEFFRGVNHEGVMYSLISTIKAKIAPYEQAS
ncbi:PilZ domain-containing protein [Bdellovibrio bacteriovorus]|uniref:PilZ domain-containing protein n=1 Tax=Bdellovibrio bacteriovorus TaxID=959 RepID=UPI0005A019FB|nr:PilZ domain-containing protein [Bdellovibrio bacteriovorus]